MNLNELQIDTITDEQLIKLANIIMDADMGKGKYPLDQVNTELVRLGLVDCLGNFRDDLTGEADRIANKLSEIIC